MPGESEFVKVLDEPPQTNGRHTVAPRPRPFTDRGPTTKLRAADMITPRRIPPSSGWRWLIYRASGRKINPGESPDERKVRELRELIGAKVRGLFTVATLGGKGGAGKTAITALIANLFAQVRTDPVVAFDTDPAQAANLAVRVDGSASSMREINAEADVGGLGRYTDIQHLTGKSPVGLDVVSSVRHIDATAPPPETSEFTKAHDVLRRFYNVVLCDCGVDLDQPVMKGVFERADAVIMVASVVPDGAEGADISLDWLRRRGYDDLLSRVVLIINHNRRPRGRKERKATARLVEDMREHFGQWVRADHIIEMPFDPNITGTVVVDLDQLRPTTRRRALEAAAVVATGFTTTTDN